MSSTFDVGTRPLFACFYNNDAYRRDALRLERCCRHFGLPFRMIQGDELGGWRRNCNQKPRLLAALRAEVHGPIVWLDSDCVIHQPPLALLENDGEDAMLWKGGNSEKHYVSSQTMWWNDTPFARAMIDDWARLSRENPESLADPLLKCVCDNWRDRAAIAVLPDAYLKPYWKNDDDIDVEAIVISSNERRCVHPDATPRQNRVRLEPLALPYATQ